MGVNLRLLLSRCRRSLQTRIAVGILLSVLLALGISSLLLDYFLRQEMEANLSAQQFSVVSLLADDIDRSVRDRLVALDAVARNIHPGLLRDGNALASEIRRQPVLLTLFNWGVIVTDGKGTALVSLPENHGRTGVNYWEVDAIRQAIAEGRPQIGAALIGKTTRKPVIPMVVPILGPRGETVGTLIGLTNLAAANFLDEISTNRFGRKGGYLVTDPVQRIFIAATDKTRVMQPGPPLGVNPVFDRYLAGYEGSGVALSSRGVVELSSSRQVASTGWLMQAVLPIDEAFAPIHAMRWRLLYAVLVLTALAGGLTWWWLRRELKPLGESARLLGLMRDGLIPRQALPVRRNDETGALAGAFNGLLETIVAGEARAAEHTFNQRLRAIVARIPGIVIQYHVGADGAQRIPFSSDAIQDICGLVPDSLIEGADAFHALLHPDDAAAFFSSQRLSAERLQPWRCECRVRSPAGGLRWLLVDALPERDGEGGFTWHGFITDITGAKETESELRIAAATFETQEGIFITDANERIVRVNQAFSAMTGYAAAEAVGQKPSMLSSGRHSADFYRHLKGSLASNGFWQGEIWNRRKNGEVFAEWVTISAVRDEGGQVTHYVAAFSDVTEHKKAEEQIHLLAFYDPLTQLPNRRLFHDRLDQAMAAGVRTRNAGALLFLDLDGFKGLNDRHGHAMGDELLTEVARRLTACVRESDTVARLGGDEFVVILEDLIDGPDAAGQAERVAEKVRRALVQPYLLSTPSGGPGIEYQCSASIGICLFRGRDLPRDELIKRADIAMYQAKGAGRNTMRFYEGSAVGARAES